MSFRRTALALALLVLACLAPTLHAADRTELQASALQNASGNTAAYAVPTKTQLLIGIDVTAAAGTPVFDLWLQGSDDFGTTWYDLVADVALLTANDAAGGTVRTGVRDVIDNKTTTTAVQAVAIYKNLPTDKVRLKWILTGASASMTFSASMVAK